MLSGMALLIELKLFVRYLSCCLLFLSLTCFADAIYKVKKQDGSVYYTDRPVAGAEVLKLSTINNAASHAPLTKNINVNSRSKTNRPNLPNYQLTLINPLNEQHIRDNQGRVQIQAKLNPASAGEFQLWMDGELLQTQSQPAFSLVNLDRGAHQIQIKFLHKSGKILASSPLATFYLHKSSILNRAN